MNTVINPIAHETGLIPVFEEGRLRYRAPRMEDFDTFADFRTSDRAKGVGGPYSRESAFDSLAEIIGHWHLRGFGRWLVADRETDHPLGVVGLYEPVGWPEPEIAWSVFTGAEGKGIAFEAAQFSRRYAYDVLGWDTLVSCVLPDNTRSANLAKRMGAVYETDFTHTDIGLLNVYRHLSPKALK